MMLDVGHIDLSKTNILAIVSVIISFRKTREAFHLVKNSTVF